MDSITPQKLIMKIVKRYVELLKNEINVSGVYLFGSCVKNDFIHDSDIDVAVVSEDFTDDPVNDTLKLMKIRRKIDNRIEPHPFTARDFNAKNPFVKEIMKNMLKIA